MSSDRILPLALVTLLFTTAAAVEFADSPATETALLDIDGNVHGSLEQPEEGKWNVLFFLTSDCPIGNQYAPEIQRICVWYGSRGTRCFLVFVDASMTDEAIRKYIRDFGYTCCTPVHDSEHRLVRRAGVQVSSEVAVFARGGEMKYRGRIDDFNAALGVPRQFISNRDLRNALDDLVAGQSVRTPRTEAIGCFIQN
jgi:hypothetical protein